MPKNVSDDLQLGASIPISASEAVKFYPLKITPHNILTRRKIFVGNHAKILAISRQGSIDSGS